MPPPPQAKVKKSAPKGLAFARRFTKRHADPLDQVTWERRTSVITNPDGSIVFKMDGAEIPSTWSQLATDIVISKYFRKAGLHGDKALGETSVRQVVHRIATTIRDAGERFGGYFATTKDAGRLRGGAELLPGQPVRRLQLARLVQLRPLPPVRDHPGTGGNYAPGGSRTPSPARPDEIVETANAYERPQCSACASSHECPSRTT